MTSGTVRLLSVVVRAEDKECRVVRVSVGAHRFKGVGPAVRSARPDGYGVSLSGKNSPSGMPARPRSTPFDTSSGIVNKSNSITQVGQGLPLARPGADHVRREDRAPLGIAWSGRPRSWRRAGRLRIALALGSSRSAVSLRFLPAPTVPATEGHPRPANCVTSGCRQIRHVHAKVDGTNGQLKVLGGAQRVRHRRGALHRRRAPDASPRYLRHRPREG